MAVFPPDKLRFCEAKVSVPSLGMAGATVCGADGFPIVRFLAARMTLPLFWLSPRRLAAWRVRFWKVLEPIWPVPYRLRFE